MRFEHIHIPSHWEHYWTKYPEGYTILEALFDWVKHVNLMTDNLNDMNEFIEKFDMEIREEVKETLLKWLEDGTLAEIISEDVLANKATIAKETFNVYIPDDYDTLQIAIDELSKKHYPQGVTVNLIVRSGHKISYGVNVSNGDYSMFKISSEGDEIAVNDDFTGRFLTVVNAQAPVLNALVNCRSLGNGGCWYESNATGVINSGCGVINAGVKGAAENRGLYVGKGSTVSADGCIFTNAGGRGAWVTRGATLSAEYANFDNAGGQGVYVSRNSRVHMPYSSVKNAGNNGLWIHRGSTLNAQDGFDVSGAGEHGIQVTRGSTLVVNEGLKAENVGFSGIYCIDSKVIANYGILSPANTNTTYNGIENNGGFIDFTNGKITGFKNGIFAKSNSETVAEACEITNATGNGVAIDRGARVNVKNATIINSANKDIAFFEGAGGVVIASGCTTTNTAEGTATPNIVNTTMTTADGQTYSGAAFNKIDRNRGIIFN